VVFTAVFMAAGTADMAAGIAAAGVARASSAARSMVTAVDAPYVGWCRPRGDLAGVS
jgi:hypothetical protein